jgi:hypothetical protein
MEAKVRYEETEQGMVAYLTAPSFQFSFLIGKGELQAAADPGVNIWSVERGGILWWIEVVLTPIPEEVAATAVSGQEILESHRFWDLDTRVQSFGEKLIEGTMGFGRFPTGEPFAFWCTEFPDNQKVSRETAYATTVHGGHVIVYTVQGIGAGVNRDILRMKSMRVIFSMFRHT